MEGTDESDLSRDESRSLIMTLAQLKGAEEALRTVVPELTEHTYAIVQKPLYPPTRALFVGNLSSPFDNSQLQSMLEDNVANSGSFIERAWLNRKRTHSIVVVSDIEGAKLLRDKLNGKIFPEVTEQDKLNELETKDTENSVRDLLYIDFIPVKVVQSWIDQEDNGPSDALWKVEYETIRDRVIAKHIMTNYSGVEAKSSNYLIDKRGRDYDRYSRDIRHNRGYGQDRSSYRAHRPSRGSYSSSYNRDRSRDYKLLSSSYVPGAETNERNGSREYPSYRGDSHSYRGGPSGGYRRGGYYSSRGGHYGETYRSRADSNHHRYPDRVDRNGYRSETSARGRPERQDNKEKADDRDRSRSPVRPSEMDWDLEGES